MGMFGALAGVLMVFEIPLPFLAPSFYGLDISEVPVLVGTFALGPVAGAVIEVVKILVIVFIEANQHRLCGRTGQSDLWLCNGYSGRSDLSV